MCMIEKYAEFKFMKLLIHNKMSFPKIESGLISFIFKSEISDLNLSKSNSRYYDLVKN